MNNLEIWKSIPDYEGAYEVSNAGNVRGVARVDGRGVHRETALKPPALTGAVGKQYLAVNLFRKPDDCPTCGHSPKSKGKSFKIHHLVLETFVGPRPDGMVGCHNNGDKLNNHVDNLRWDTPGANNRDKRQHGTDHQVSKTHCPRGHEYSPENCYDPAMSRRRCKTCARSRAAIQDAPLNPRSHCRQGHEMRGNNVITSGKARKCRTCANTRRRARKSAQHDLPSTVDG